MGTCSYSARGACLIPFGLSAWELHNDVRCYRAAYFTYELLALTAHLIVSCTMMAAMFIIETMNDCAFMAHRKLGAQAFGLFWHSQRPVKLTNLHEPTYYIELCNRAAFFASELQHFQLIVFFPVWSCRYSLYLQALSILTA